MKVLFPRHIQKGFFNISFQIGPLTISLVQLFILACGVGASLMIFRAVLGANGNTFLGAVLAIPLFIIFVIIAFFEVSEMGLIQFLAKLMKTYFFDTPKKLQVNYARINKTQVDIQEFLSKQQKKIIDIKEHTLDEKITKKLKNQGLLD